MINIGIVSVSDRAFNKVYQDQGIPEIENLPGNPKSISELLPNLINQLEHFIEKR